VRSELLLIASVLAVLFVGCTDICRAAYPVPDRLVTVTLLHGWVDDQAAWYVPTLSSDPKFAEVPQISILDTGTLTFAPGFAACIDAGLANDVYIVVNYVQGPVFSTAPTEPDIYTPIWQVNTVTWLDPNKARPITNDKPADALNPTGLPSPDEAVIVRTNVVLNASILAVGPLKGAWLPAPQGTYRIPQGTVCDQQSKTLLMPAYDVFCQNPLTQRGIWLRTMLILDAADSNTARMFGANLSTRLSTVPPELMQRLYVMNEPKPMSQLPIVRECPVPNRLSIPNTNYRYTPLMLITAMDRHIPLYAVINNVQSLDWLLQAELLTIADESKIVNAPLAPLASER
jgi:hypothetical protein